MLAVFSGYTDLFLNSLYLYFVFYFSPLNITGNYKLLTTENEIILDRRGEHLGRLILYIMAKKNRCSIDIKLKTAEQMYIYS